MRTFDLSPYYRSTIGFDRLFDLLNDGVRSDWPPYDIEKRSEDQYRITMAVAGFAPNDIELVQHGPALQVMGQRSEAPGAQMLHRGIPSAGFKQSFNLADHMKVAGASLEHGLLTIDLVREASERVKPRLLEIVSGGQKQVERSAAPQSKAA